MLGDISKAADVERLFAKTKKSFGSLDVLVNNAGSSSFIAGEGHRAGVSRQFGTNVLGLILATREAVKYFDGDGGSVVDVAQLASLVRLDAGERRLLGTKGRWTRSPACSPRSSARGDPREFDQPGRWSFKTEGFHAAGLAGGDFREEQRWHGRRWGAGPTRDIAPLAVFLASPDSQWLTGRMPPGLRGHAVTVTAR